MALLLLSIIQVYKSLKPLLLLLFVPLLFPALIYLLFCLLPSEIAAARPGQFSCTVWAKSCICDYLQTFNSNAANLLQQGEQGEIIGIEIKKVIKRWRSRNCSRYVVVLSLFYNSVYVLSSMHYYIIRHWLSSLALDMGLGSCCCCCEWFPARLALPAAGICCCCCWLYKFLRPLTWCALSWFFNTGSDCLLCWWSSITNWLKISGALACLNNSLNTRSMLSASFAEQRTNELPCGLV